MKGASAALRRWSDGLGRPLPLAYHDNFVEDATGHLELAHALERQSAAIRENQGDDVGVDVEAGAFLGDVVRHHEVQIFRLELAAGIFYELFRLGGEAH